MAARPRSPKRKNWPPHLIEKRPGYYAWRHPQTKQEFGLGRDFKRACLEAMEANLKLAQMVGARRLVDRMEGRKGTISEWAVEFRKRLDKRGLRPNTVKTNEWRLRKIESQFGSMVMERVTTKDLADWLGGIVDGGHERTAASLRSMLDDMWREAAGAGWVSSNPVDALSKITVSVKRERLSLEQFVAIYEAAARLDAFHQRLMELAIITAQPRECLVAWEFGDEHDGFLWNERGKTGARIKIPMTLTVPTLGWRLSDVVRRCRDNVLSKHMIHHTRKYAWSELGDPLFIDSASKAFARARDLSGLTWDGSAPSLHEIRSLSLRLYKDAYGRDFAQSLAGHKDGSTTDIYTDVRGSEWIEVRFG